MKRKRRVDLSERKHRFLLVVLAVVLSFILFLTNHPEGVKLLDIVVEILGVI